MTTVGRIVLVGIALGAVACGGVRPGGTPASSGSDPSQASSPLDGEWDLVAWSEQGEPVEAAQVGLESIRMNVDGTSARGQGPCNRYEAGLEVDGTALRVDVTGRTLIGCPDGPRDEPYLDALERIETYERDEDRIVLTGADTRLVYEEVPAVPDSPLAGTSWTLTSLHRNMPDRPEAGTEAADVPAREGEEPTLLLGHDGELTADTGCRQLTGRWERDGDHVHFHDIVAADGACDEPDLEDREARQLEVFESQMDFEVDGNLLELWTDQQGLGYTDRPDSAETGP